MRRALQPLEQVIGALEKQYGRPKKPIPKTPLDWILWENVAYLVDDERRERAFRALAKIGRTAEKIAHAPRESLLAVTSLGGMHPEARVDRLYEIAELALEHGGGDLSAVLRLPESKARRALKQFPSIGDPGADKILLFCGVSTKFALESNGLRALTRIGFGTEEKSYAATYRSVLASVSSDLCEETAWLTRAHQLLRVHGQSLCKRTAPDCDACPLTAACRYASSAR
jgi:endonuclease III